jgi:hypothetical protein
LTELIKILYSEHAKQQLNERNISCQLIEKTLLEPQQTLKGKNDRKIAHRIFQIKGQNFLLRVIYEDFGNQLEIVTAYLTTKIDKYWRIP